MANKRIISVGKNFPDERVENVSLNTRRSLLDADIIIFNPTFASLNLSYAGSYHNKNVLASGEAHNLNLHIEHWYRELIDACTAGKCIFILLSKPETIYISQNTTFDLLSSYELLPLRFTTVTTHGKAVKPCLSSSYFDPYWQAYKEEIEYQCYLEGNFDDILLTTKSGGKTIAAAMKGEGIMVMLPPPNQELSTPKIPTVDHSQENLKKHSKKFIDCLISIHKAFKTGKNLTPPPEWTKDSSYKSLNENKLESEIAEITAQISTLESLKTVRENELAQESNLKRLLYEQSHPLEEAIIEALTILGFTAEGYKDDSSEFDIVFSSAEGSLLGEAEGKDNKAVEISKLRQLLMNREEYFGKNGHYPKGVLFGNPQRLLPLAERTEIFTAKCKSSAKEHRFSLVLTTELFWAAKYVKETENTIFATECRKAIIETEGEIVQFPTPPQ